MSARGCYKCNSKSIRRYYFPLTTLRTIKNDVPCLRSYFLDSVFDLLGHLTSLSYGAKTFLRTQILGISFFDCETKTVEKKAQQLTLVFYILPLSLSPSLSSTHTHTLTRTSGLPRLKNGGSWFEQKSALCETKDSVEPRCVSESARLGSRIDRELFQELEQALDQAQRPTQRPWARFIKSQ